MSNVLRIAIVDPRDGTREQLKSMLLGMEIVWLEAECSRYEFFSDVVNETIQMPVSSTLMPTQRKPSPSSNGSSPTHLNAQSWLHLQRPMGSRSSAPCVSEPKSF